MARKYVKLWAVPEFKNKIKEQASRRGMTAIQFQEWILKRSDPITELFEEKNGKKKKQEFYI